MVIAKEKPFDPEEDLRRYADIVDQPAKSAPRKTATPRKSAAPTAAAKEVPLEQIRTSIRDMYLLGGTFLKTLPKTAIIGGAIEQQAEQCAESIIEAAKNDPRLRRALSKMFKASAYGGIVMAHMPILMAAYMTVQLNRMPQQGGTDEPNVSPVDTVFFPGQNVA